MSRDNQALLQGLREHFEEGAVGERSQAEVEKAVAQAVAREIGGIDELEARIQKAVRDALKGVQR